MQLCICSSAEFCCVVSTKLTMLHNLAGEAALIGIFCAVSSKFCLVQKDSLGNITKNSYLMVKCRQ